VGLGRRRLYLKGAKNAAVLGELFHRTKNQILSETIDEIVKSGDFRGWRVGVDGAFGRDRRFLDSLPKSPHLFRLNVPCSQQVYPERP
jgi:hypothetical protein